MGSAGSGRFGTYRIEQTNYSNEGTGNAGSGGTSVEVNYPTIIPYINLEDVATSEFYAQNKDVPDKGISVYLDDRIHNGRLVVRHSETDEILGNLPTQYNYLLNNIKRGTNYTGEVVTSGLSPVPFVVVTLHV